MIEGLTRALQIVEAEIARAEALLSVEENGGPVFDPAQMEAGLAALRTVAHAIEGERNADCGTDPLSIWLDAPLSSIWRE